jgi:alkylation response protein AidB-like acyl-CoA dehydrogenase
VAFLAGLGFATLATAEVAFAGAEAYPVGPLDRGLANVVSSVLVTSRFACVGVAAAFLRRAERIAEAYADFRYAFGRKLADFPLVQETLAAVCAGRERTLASVFELMRLWQTADRGGSETSTVQIENLRRHFAGKPVLTREATARLHDAMMVLGGNGVEERFSPLPRLWRDAVVMETWEGPHNVLFTQAVRDMRRYDVDAAAFITRVAGTARRDLVQELAAIVASGAEPEAAVRMARFARKLVEALGDRVVEECRSAQ